MGFPAPRFAKIPNIQLYRWEAKLWPQLRLLEREPQEASRVGGGTSRPRSNRNRTARYARAVGCIRRKTGDQRRMHAGRDGEDRRRELSIGAYGEENLDAAKSGTIERSPVCAP